MSNVDKTVKNLFDTQLTKTGLSTFYVEKTLKTLKRLSGKIREKKSSVILKILFYIPYHFLDLGVKFHIFLNLLTGIYYCGVMSAVKFVSYLLH